MNLRSSVVILAAIGLVAVAGPALATGNTYGVAVNGSTTPGARSIEVSSVGPVRFTVPGTPVIINCVTGSTGPSSSSVATSGPTGILDLLQIDGLQLSDCVLTPGGVAVGITVDDGIVLHGTDPVTAAKTDVPAAHLDYVSAQVRSVIPGLRDVDIDGLAESFYSEVADVIVVDETNSDGDLVVAYVSGCMGQFASGDPAWREATFSVQDGSGTRRV